MGAILFSTYRYFCIKIVFYFKLSFRLKRHIKILYLPLVDYLFVLLSVFCGIGLVGVFSSGHWSQASYADSIGYEITPQRLKKYLDGI